MDSPKTGKVLRRHAARRAEERLGVKLTDDQLLKLGEQIRSGALECIGKVSKRRTLWKTTLNGIPAVLAYDHRRSTVATITDGDRFARSPHQQKVEKVEKRRQKRKRRRSVKRHARESGRSPRDKEMAIALQKHTASRQDAEDGEVMRQW